MTRANFTPWYFHANVMAEAGGMYAPIVLCRLSQHTGEYGRRLAKTETVLKYQRLRWLRSDPQAP
jgi:hypothetical protein